MTGPRIVVACSDADWAEAVCRHLRNGGFDAAAAEDAFTLAQKLQAAKPDLLIVDFALPGGDGPTLYERLQGNTRTMDVPIIFISDISPEEARRKVPASAKVAFLGKPVSVSLLEGIIGRILGPRKPPQSRPLFTGEADDSDEGPTVVDLD